MADVVFHINLIQETLSTWYIVYVYTIRNDKKSTTKRNVLNNLAEIKPSCLHAYQKRVFQNE